MTWYLWALVAVVVLLIGVYLDLFVAHHGIAFLEEPTGKAFWVRQGSWLTLLTGSDGVTVDRTIHFRGGYRPRAILLAHECRHLQQIAAPGMGPHRFLWRYLTSGTFRRAVETDAKEWGDLNYGAPWIQAIAVTLQRVYDREHA